jgi:hypothetical protein
MKSEPSRLKIATAVQRRSSFLPGARADRFAGRTARSLSFRYGNDLAAAPDVVPERDRIGAAASILSRELRRDPDAVGEVLAVEDADVCAELLLQRGQALLDGAPVPARRPRRR